MISDLLSRVCSVLEVDLSVLVGFGALLAHHVQTSYLPPKSN